MDLSHRSGLLVQRQSINLQQDLFFGRVPGGEPYALITSCSDVVYFLKSSKSDSATRLVFNSYWGRDIV
jgi:hypothetical protein